MRQVPVFRPGEEFIVAVPQEDYSNKYVRYYVEWNDERGDIGTIVRIPE